MNEIVTNSPDQINERSSMKTTRHFWRGVECTLLGIFDGYNPVMSMFDYFNIFQRNAKDNMKCRSGRNTTSR